MTTDMEWVLAAEDAETLERRLRIANAKVVFATYYEAAVHAQRHPGRVRLESNENGKATYRVEPLAQFPLTKAGVR